VWGFLATLMRPFAILIASILGSRYAISEFEKYWGMNKPQDQLSSEEISRRTGATVGFISGAFLAVLLFGQDGIKVFRTTKKSKRKGG